MDEYETIEHIKREILKSGHSVSVKVSKILNSRGWYVQDSSRFKENEKDEHFFEIDVLARKDSSFAGSSMNTLCIECKKQENKNWVFFKQNKANTDVRTLTCAYPDDTDKDSLLERIEKTELFLSHYYYQEPLCTYYFITDTDSQKERSQLIDKGIEQVLRAVNFYSRRNSGWFSEPEFFYPIIVFDGNMFVASLEGETISVERSSHINLYIEREFSKVYQTRTNTLVTSKPFIIDIVKLDWFESFLDYAF